MTLRAVVIATAATPDGGAAALLPTPEGPVLARTVTQLARFGAAPVTVVTRPEWLGTVAAAVAPLAAVEVHGAGSAAEALHCLADILGTAEGPVLLVDGEVVAHDAVIDGVLGDPRVGTGVVVTRDEVTEPLLYARIERGRVTAAESPYHRVTRAHAVALGVLKVGATDGDAAGEAAEALAELLSGPLPDGWDDELTAKVQRWTDAEHSDPSFARRLAGRDVLALLLTALCRQGVAVSAVAPGEFPCVRVYSEEAAGAAVEHSAALDAERLRLAAAVKGRDGFVTTFLVSPYSRYIARWAARRGLRPNQVTVGSMLLGVVAAGLFAMGTRGGLVAGAVVLWAAFVADCVDGQLARYTRQFSKLGAWLDATFDRAKEYVVFAGLAAGGMRAGDDGTVWLLAAAALALQVTRHAIAFSYGLSQRTPLAAAAPAPRPLTDPADAGEPAAAVAGGDVGGGAPADVAGADVAAAADVAGADDAPADVAGADVAGADVAGADDAPADVARADVAPSASAVAADTELLADDQPQSRSPLAALGRAGVGASRFFEQRPWLKWAKRIFVFPIGERFLVIAVTAAVTGPRTVFVVLLVWGSLALAYTATGRLLRSVV